MKVRLATRGSTLALIQAQLVADALARAHPGHEFVLEPISTHGDRHPAMRLSESPREGVFVKELEKALLERRAELAVHSAKDLPTADTPGLVLAAFLPRADARDVLVSRAAASLVTLPAGARVGTGSPRRAAQIASIRPDLITQEVRGNVDTRLRRLDEGVVDALVLAAAGLERLGRLDVVHEFLPFEVMLPAPGQGALAVQALQGSDPAGLAAVINHDATSRAVVAERALLRRLGGGCLSAIGAIGVVAGGQLALQAAVLDRSGRRVLRAQARGRSDTAVVDQVAGELERLGAGALLTSSDGPLAGLRVLVTRAGGQAQALTDGLRARGASVVSCPVIQIEPLAVDPQRLRVLPDYDWLVLTSANGVDRLFELLDEAKLTLPAHIKVAAIGPQTASRLRRRGVTPALVPRHFIAEQLAEELAAVVSPASRVLLARAAGARDVLSRRLESVRVPVDVVETYRAVPPAGLAARLSAVLPGVDIVTLTSSSSARHFAQAAGDAIEARLQFACIGPVTAHTARELGMRVDIIAQEYTTRGLVEAIVRSRTRVSP